MGPRAEREVLVGETAEELAGQTARALGDPELRRSLGRAGRDWVAAHHAVAAAREGQKHLVLHAAGRWSDDSGPAGRENKGDAS